jgi:hypothetical protein
MLRWWGDGGTKEFFKLNAYWDLLTISPFPLLHPSSFGYILQITQQYQLWKNLKSNLEVRRKIKMIL